MIRFSIIVPVYNVEKYLDRCLQSICNQSFADIEIIIIDDGSNDSSSEIYEKYAGDDERIVIIRQANQGLSAARNTGMNHASGEYIIFVDSDDYIDVDTCERFNTIIKKNAPDMIIGNAITHEGSLTYPMAHSNLHENMIYTGIEYSRLAISAREWYSMVWLGCYSRRFIEQRSLRFKTGICHEDLEVQPRLFLDTKTIIYMDKPFYHYCLRPDSITTSNNESYTNRKCSDIMSVLGDWKQVFGHKQYESIQKLLYGMLAKQFLYFSRLYKNTDIKRVKGVDFSFLWRNALDKKEKAKALLFFLFPHLYVKL